MSSPHAVSIAKNSRTSEPLGNGRGPSSMRPDPNPRVTCARRSRATRRRPPPREELPHERAAWERAGAALNAARPEAARDMREAFARDPALIDSAAKGRTTQAIRAIMVEAEVRTNPSMRADRFVQDWSRLAERKEALRSADDDRGLARIQKGMHGLAKSLERDPQIESLVRQRLPEIGIKIEKGASLSHDLQKWLSRSRDIGLSLDRKTVVLGKGGAV